MKILIVSDTHGRHDNLIEVLDKVKPLDMLIHLGDAEGEEDYIEVLAECPLEIIAGNNDFFCELPREKSLRLGKYQVLLTHGHYYGVNMGTTDIKREAAARNYDIVMFGHTHRPLIDKDKDIIALNPGSISFPRQEGRKPSCIVMETAKNGDASFEMLYL